MIISSAIKTKKGKVYVGRRHDNVFENAEEVCVPLKFMENLTMGFITDDLEFLNREEAYLHAVENGQCVPQSPEAVKYAEGLESKKKIGNLV